MILSTGGCTWSVPRGGTWSGIGGVYLVWSRGVYLAATPGTRYTPGPGTPPQTRYTPLEPDQVHSLSSGSGNHPPGPGTPPGQTRYTTPPQTRYTPGTRPGTSPNTANERPVRILLECILKMLTYRQEPV